MSTFYDKMHEAGYEDADEYIESLIEESEYRESLLPPIEEKTDRISIISNDYLASVYYQSRGYTDIVFSYSIKERYKGQAIVVFVISAVSDTGKRVDIDVFPFVCASPEEVSQLPPIIDDLIIRLSTQNIYYAFEKEEKVIQEQVPRCIKYITKNRLFSFSGDFYHLDRETAWHRRCDSFSSTIVTDDDLKDAYIDSSGVMYSGKKKIALLRGEKVRESLFMPNVYSNRRELKSYRVDDNTQIICDAAFGGFEKLSSITLPKGLKSIGASSFRNCIELEDIVIPGSIIHLGGTVFEGCKSLKSVRFCANNQERESLELSGSLFYNCRSLETISLQEYICSIGWDDFVGCDSLKNIELPNSIVIIHSRAFQDCISLERIVLSAHLEIIEDSVFYNCRSLKEVCLPNSIRTMGKCVFKGCSSLESISLPDGLLTIEPESFMGCKSLKHIEVPYSVRSIKRDAFKGCSSLVSVQILGAPDISESAFEGVPYFS